MEMRGGEWEAVSISWNEWDKTELRGKSVIFIGNEWEKVRIRGNKWE